MSSPAITPEMRVHCDDSQANRILLRFPRPPTRSAAAKQMVRQQRAVNAMPARRFAVGFGPAQTFSPHVKK